MSEHPAEHLTQFNAQLFYSHNYMQKPSELRLDIGCMSADDESGFTVHFREADHFLLAGPEMASS